MSDAIEHKHDGAVASTDEALPVVARLVIEIRSDGSRTVARGALADHEHGERVGIEARGGSPAELAGQLLRAVATQPVQAALAWVAGSKEHVVTVRREPEGLVERVRQRAVQAVRRGLRLE